jgi:hypothetical protein
LGLEMSNYRGLPIVEHSGALNGYRTEILRFPEQRFSVVTLCNVSNANVTALAREVADIYLQGSLNKESSVPQIAKDYPDAGRFAGKYLDGRDHFVYSFAPSGNTLSAWGAELRRVGPNEFRDLGTGLITFTGSSNAMRATLVMDGKAFFDGKRVEAPHLSEAQLSEYVGRYYSAEIEATYDVQLESGSLAIRLRWNPPMKLEPLAADEFECRELGTVVFERDAQHRITRLRVFDVEARGVEFERRNE